MLKQRVLTALAIGPLSLVLLFTLTGLPFATFVGFVILLGAWEWANLSGIESPGGRFVYTLAIFAGMAATYLTEIAFQRWPMWVALATWIVCCGWVLSYPVTRKMWEARATRLVLGGLIMLPSWMGLQQLRGVVAESSWFAWWLLYVLFIIWGADISAYFAGKAFGKRKLAPRVSPGKSWAGVYGALAGTAVLSFIMDAIQKYDFQQAMVLLGVTWLVTLTSVVGDLFESMLKRYRGLKDSSQLLPGHGGMLDRIDSLLAAIPVFALFLPLLIR